MITARESQILELIATGLTNCQAAAVLGIKENTVKCHLHHIRLKMKVSNTAQAVYHAVCLGIIPKMGEEP